MKKLFKHLISRTFLWSKSPCQLIMCVVWLEMIWDFGKWKQIRYGRIINYRHQSGVKLKTCSTLFCQEPWALSRTSLVIATLGTAGWWNSDLLFILISASELWRLIPSNANLSMFLVKNLTDLKLKWLMSPTYHYYYCPVSKRLLTFYWREFTSERGTNRAFYEEVSVPNRL